MPATTNPIPTAATVPSQPVADPLAEAEAIRVLLHEGQARLGRLVSFLKHHRRQSRALQSAVASLRQLPPIT